MDGGCGPSGLSPSAPQGRWGPACSSEAELMEPTGAGLSMCEAPPPPACRLLLLLQEVVAALRPHSMSPDRLWGTGLLTCCPPLPRAPPWAPSAQGFVPCQPQGPWPGTACLCCSVTGRPWRPVLLRWLW